MTLQPQWQLANDTSGTDVSSLTLCRVGPKTCSKAGESCIPDSSHSNAFLPRPMTALPPRWQPGCPGRPSAQLLTLSAASAQDPGEATAGATLLPWEADLQGMGMGGGESQAEETGNVGKAGPGDGGRPCWLQRGPWEKEKVVPKPPYTPGWSLPRLLQAPADMTPLRSIIPLQSTPCQPNQVTETEHDTHLPTGLPDTILRKAAEGTRRAGLWQVLCQVNKDHKRPNDLPFVFPSEPGVRRLPTGRSSEAVRASLLPSEEGMVPVRSSTDHTDAGVRREKSYLNTDLWRTSALGRRLGRN